MGILGGARLDAALSGVEGGSGGRGASAMAQCSSCMRCPGARAAALQDEISSNSAFSGVVGRNHQGSASLRGAVVMMSSCFLRADGPEVV